MFGLRCHYLQKPPNVMMPRHFKYRDISGIIAGTLRCLFFLPFMVRLGMACISYAFHMLTSA